MAKRVSNNPDDYQELTVANLVWTMFQQVHATESLHGIKYWKSGGILLTRTIGHVVILNLQPKHIKALVDNAMSQDGERRHVTPKVVNKAIAILKDIAKQDRFIPLIKGDHFIHQLQPVSYTNNQLPNSFVAKRMKALNKDDFKDGSLGYAMCAYRDKWYGVSRKQSTIEDINSTIRSILRCTNPDKLLTKFNEDDVLAIRNKLSGKHATNSSANKALNYLRNISRNALSKGVISVDFCGDIKNTPRGTSKNKENYFKRQEIEKVTATATSFESDKLLLQISLDTGWRPCEGISIGRDSVKFFYDERGVERAKITIDLAKGANGDLYTFPKGNLERTITTSATCVPLLKRALQLSNRYPAIKVKKLDKDNKQVQTITRQFLFVNQRTARPWEVSADYTRQFMRPFLKDAGVPHRGLSLTRHTFATLSLEGGATPRVLKKHMGHSDSSRVLETNYAHITATMEQEAWEISDGILAKEFGYVPPRPNIQMKIRPRLRLV